MPSMAVTSKKENLNGVAMHENVNAGLIQLYNHTINL